jgi:uncharacterized protein
MSRKSITLGATALVIAMLPLPGLCSDVRELHWAELIPPAAAQTAPATAKPKTFFSGSNPVDANAPAPPPMAEGKFMQIKRRQPGSGGAPAVVADLDGKRVSIGGYIVPLDFEATTVKEFLLVPFVGACIHVPPPPANQIIYVKSSQGFEVSGSFDAVTVTGTLKTTVAFTGLADAGYTLDADAVTTAKP